MASDKKINRRTMLQLGLGATAGTVTGGFLLGQGGSASCEMSPEQIIGPFYPIRDQADKDVDLTLLEGHTERAEGGVIYVGGRIMDEECNPVSGALVEIWQANKAGRYSHERDPNPAPLDPNFQGWGQAVTDEEGSYRFKTIKPGAYPLAFLDGEPNEEAGWRAPHIHFRVARRGFHELITQCYFAGESLNDQDGQIRLLSEEERVRVILSPQEAGTGGESEVKVYPFDLVIKRVQSAVVGDEVLESYAGKYMFEDPGEGPAAITVIKEGKQLYVEAPPFLPRVEIRPLTQERFSISALGAEATFYRNRAGRVEGMTLHHASGPDVRLKKGE